MSECRSCPECAEDVGAGDAKCRHCGAALLRREVLQTPREKGFDPMPYCILLLIVAIIAALALPGLIEPPGVGNETGAIGSLKTIGVAQALFRESDREADGVLDYGTLTELANPQPQSTRPSGLIDSVLGSGTKQGYIFETTYGASTSEFIWFATARPAIPGTTGERYFCTNHEGKIFYTASQPFGLNSMDCTIPAGATPLGR